MDAKLENYVQASRCDCTKLYKQGNVVGNAVDLSKLRGYDEFIHELEHLFNREDILKTLEEGWHIVHTEMVFNTYQQ